MRQIITVAEPLLFEGKPFCKKPVVDDCSSTPFSTGVKVMIFEASAGVYCMALPPAANNNRIQQLIHCTFRTLKIKRNKTDHKV